MRYPSFLREGGAIGFVAPSFGCSIEPYRSAFDHSLKVWSEKGHPVLLGPNVYEGSGTGISSTPQRCGRELTESYVSEESDVLISCGGGELMCEILDFVNFDQIRTAAPKWYLGYSDNTNFTFLLTTQCDTASIYGPCAPAFGMNPWHPAIQDTYDLLLGKKLRFSGYELYETESKKDETHPLEPYHVTQPRKIISWVPSTDPGNLDGRGAASSLSPGISGAEASEEIRFSGRLIGGCMDCLVNLLGTKYDSVKAFTDRYAQDGFLWFLEACDLNVYAIRRAIWQMQHAGWFSHVKGFLIGRPANGQEMFGLDHMRAVTDLLSCYQVPILMDLDIGHLPPQIPLICGAYASVRCQGQEFSLDMELR